jgi:hypothetical protein
MWDRKSVRCVLTVVDGGRHYIIEVQTTLDLDSAVPLLKFVLEDR